MEKFNQGQMPVELEFFTDRKNETFENNVNYLTIDQNGR